MSAAYFKLLRETTDPEFHDALIRSQRRWLEVREHGPDSFGEAEGDTTNDREILFTVTYDRMMFLRTGDPILTMEQQRKIRLQDSGGAFTGYKTHCVLQPPPYGNWNCECWGDTLRQHNDRICSSVMEWASGHMTEYQAVSVLKNGEPKVVATCSTGYATTSEQCPLPDADVWNKLDSHWNTTPAPSDYLPTLDTRSLEIRSRYFTKRNRSAVDAGLPVRSDLPATAGSEPSPVQKVMPPVVGPLWVIHDQAEPAAIPAMSAMPQ